MTTFKIIAGWHAWVDVEGHTNLAEVTDTGTYFQTGPGQTYIGGWSDKPTMTEVAVARSVVEKGRT